MKKEALSTLEETREEKARVVAEAEKEAEETKANCVKELQELKKQVERLKAEKQLLEAARNGLC